MDHKYSIQQARMQLVETGGRVSQDLGAGRIVGQVLVYLYLQESECSLDEIGENIGLSKASVSIAVRQLEKFGLARKVWKSGDKKSYYKSAENIANALQQGVLSFVSKKIQLFGGELESSLEIIDKLPDNSQSKDEIIFLKKRIERAKKLRNSLERLLGNPLVKLFTSTKSSK